MFFSHLHTPLPKPHKFPVNKKGPQTDVCDLGDLWADTNVWAVSGQCLAACLLWRPSDLLCAFR